MNYFTVTHKTTREDIEKQKKQWAVKLHPDKGLTDSDEQYKEMMSQYSAAKQNVLYFETLRGTDEHGKAVLHGLFDYVFDQVLDKVPDGPIKTIIKNIPMEYKNDLIENMNISEILAKIEQKIKQ